MESSNYFKDKDSVYLKTEKIKNIDINSVKVL
ncbi:TPA: hypothetical protein DEG21_01570 [Patescibacteria group bacterium]|nr:hypothetical protein [Candidatus Gracilibacteria bacterium]HBY74579.1 hypothetical protein [Candidatus Gracilibacteria bacterium]